jgi:cytidylate kinase
MGLITVSGEPGCRHEEAARLAAQRLHFELVTESGLRGMMAEEFGEDTPIPDRAYPHAVASILTRLATEHHLVVCADAAAFLCKGFPNLLRVHLIAPESRRIGLLMVERRLERPAAKELIDQLEAEHKADCLRRFGRSAPAPYQFDLVVNTELLDTEYIAEIIETAASVRGVKEQGLLAASAEAQLQFQIRLQLSKHGLQPPGKVRLKKVAFGHPSEEVFATLLDFYRIVWEYEPHNFPIQWDKDGRVLESFTPDFYLPEFDTYIELTTMKQSLVTKKNHKVKLLRTIYPHISIQVFYQKDFRNLIFKYGLGERTVEA